LPGNEDQMTLTDTMVVTIEGSLVMDGTGATIPCLRGDRNLGDARGGYTPPVLKYYGASNMNITLDLEMQGTVVVFGDSGQPIALGGDHSNQSQSPECFDCTNAIFRLNGLEPRTFEVGGRNLGSVPAGFESNFAIGTVEVAADGNVTFTDAFDNDAEGQGPCTEALYVHELILGANSTVKLDNCRVYYETLVDYGATLAAIGCGELLEMQDMVNPPLAEDNGDGPCASDGECPNAAACIGGVCYVPKNRYLSIRRNPDNSGYHTARRVRVETATSGTVLLGWVDEPVLDPVEDIWTALLVDEPVYNGVDFAGEWPDVVHVKGCEIVPGQTYVIQAIMDGQSVGDESNYSEALALPSAPVWGDVVGICPFDVCEPPEGDPFTQPNIDDVLALVNAFVGIDNAPLTWLDIDPVVGNGYPEGYVVIGDVLAVVNAFSGQQYPGDGPVGCE
jgi:hypothetical protein